MKLVLHRYPMFHYFVCVLLAVTFQLPSIVTPALAYPLVSNNTLQEGLVRRMDMQSSSSLTVPPTNHNGGYREVHPCRSSFDLFTTKLYEGVSTTLHACTTLEKDGKIAIAFWPWIPDGDPSCGLVWSSMELTEDEGAKQGTCIVGPINPKYTRNGLSPCQQGFIYENSFYDRISHQKYQKGQPRDSRMSLVQCRADRAAVAWRMARGTTCITLPLHENDHFMNNVLGYCFGYRPDRHKQWCLDQVIKPEERDAYHSLAGGKPKGPRDWVEMPAGFDLKLSPGGAGQAEHQ